MSITYRIDPITRYVYISYPSPDFLTEEITVRCEVSSDDGSKWSPASVWKYMSDTAKELISQHEWERGILHGLITEKCAKGSVRTLVWNPFSSASGNSEARFRIIISDGNEVIQQNYADMELDNSDVIVLDDWSKVIQGHFVSEAPNPDESVWWLRPRQNGFSLAVKEKGVELPQLTYALDLHGYYAIFVLMQPILGTIELRLSGDERTQIFHSRKLGMETFWRWTDMTRQHLIIKQPYSTVYEYEDEYRAHLDSVRMVPLKPELVEQLNSEWRADGERRIVAGYSEPYSWAFYENIQSPLQHWEPLLAFAEAGVDIIDTQMGRGGCRMVNETRTGSQLIADTIGDPVRGKVPRTSNVGRMQQYTNMLATQLRYARELGMKFHANLGATNCYVGTPLESDFSKQHPEWRTGSQLRYDIPEVRQFILALLEEALQIGAEGLSIDWCRYPYSITDRETVTDFFRELRLLTDNYGEDSHIDILTRFPARGVPCWEFMDYNTWVKEELIDFLCPSNIQGRHLNFDISEYLEAVRGTKAKLLPCVDALSWGLPKPGLWLLRILECYEAGSDGVYIYQCDSPVLSSPETRRYVSIIGSVNSLKRWREIEDSKQSEYSRGIYINPPNRDGKYHPWERVRLWIEGIVPEKVELLVDGRVVNTYQSPPYILASEDRSDDDAIKSGRHILKVRAKHREGWLEQEFDVEFS
jgi:hypothetical protein